MSLRDWNIALTDLALAAVCAWATTHASGGFSNFSGTKDSDFVGIAFCEVGLCAFLGFVCWGFVPNWNRIHSLYRFLINLTKFASVPYLLAACIKQNQISQMQLFTLFHATFFLFEFVLKHNTKVARYYDDISKLFSIGSLVLLAIQGFLEQNFLQLSAAAGMVLVASTSGNIPLFHVMMCIEVWLIESARSGSFIQSF